MIRKENLPYCPIATLIRIIGGKWKILPVGELEKGPRRFGELLKELEGLSRRVLRESLR